MGCLREMIDFVVEQVIAALVLLQSQGFVLSVSSSTVFRRIVLGEFLEIMLQSNHSVDMCQAFHSSPQRCYPNLCCPEPLPILRFLELEYSSLVVSIQLCLLFVFVSPPSAIVLFSSFAS